jgi:hypothetical protein
MALPANYTVEAAVGNLGKIAIYRASHPIHGTVAVYKPAEQLRHEQLTQVRQLLYQHSLWLRDISERDISGIAKALEVSQNPDDPYIVTAWWENDLATFLDTAPKLKRSAATKLFAGICKAVSIAEVNGFSLGQLQASSIKLEGVNPVLLTVGVLSDLASSSRGTLSIASQPGMTDGSVTQTLKTGISKDKPGSTQAPTVTIREGGTVTLPNHQETTEVVHMNLYTLGTILYQLLFREKYYSADARVAGRIKGLPKRWRVITSRLINMSGESYYSSYDTLLLDVRKALARNKRVVLGFTPVFVLLLVLMAWWGHNWYSNYQIRTSNAAEALKQFMNLAASSTSLPEVPRVRDVNVIDNDAQILKTFEGILHERDKQSTQ